MAAQFPGWCVMAPYQRRDLRSVDDSFLGSSQAVSKSFMECKVECKVCTWCESFLTLPEPGQEATGEAGRLEGGGRRHPSQSCGVWARWRPAGQGAEEILPNLPLSPLISSLLLLSGSGTAEQLLPHLFMKVLTRRGSGGGHLHISHVEQKKKM